MLGCWLYRDGEYMLISDSGAVVGTLIPMDDQRLGERLKRPYEPSRWFKMDAGIYSEKMERKGA